MKNQKTTFRIFSWIITLLFAFSLLSFSVFATGEGGEGGAPSGDEPVATQADIAPETEAPYIEAETEAPADEPEQAEEETEEIAAISTYTEPEHLNELPTVMPQEVMLATEIPLPDVVVSDTSLLGGVMAWLCVAVGIALIVGVMVSKRTRRSGR